MQETYAQWQNGQPVNERRKELIRIPNTNHQAHRMTPEQLAQVGWYRVLRIEIGEGERLDNESWHLGNHSITQIGTIIDAETVAAEAQQARHDEIIALISDPDKQAVERVQALGRVLARFTDPETGEPYQFPLNPENVYAAITAALAAGTLTEAEEASVALLEVTYRRALAVMTDADIAAVASIIGGEQ